MERTIYRGGGPFSTSTEGARAQRHTSQKCIHSSFPAPMTCTKTRISPTNARWYDAYRSRYASQKSGVKSNLEVPGRDRRASSPARSSVRLGNKAALQYLNISQRGPASDLKRGGIPPGGWSSI